MCGICGYTGKEVPGLVDTMLRNIASRGPDGQGSWSTHDVFLGHTRLAVIDPAHGQQPMTRISDRYTVSYNGEIYNYPELRRELEKRGHTFHTNCDTELIPVGYSVWGDDLWPRLEGIFALALYDQENSELRLVRDQIGVKPLYYADIQGNLVFASTSGAVGLHPSVGRQMRPDAVREFLQYRWVRSGQHLFKDIEILKPGTFLIRSEGLTTVRRYWDLRENRVKDALSPETWHDKVGTILEQSVQRQLVSDVPIGIFLSGGIDSSLIACYAARHIQQDMTAFTFSVGDNADETALAADFARSCGFAHRAVGMDEADLMQFPEIVSGMPNPVGDTIVVPTWALCRAAAKDVKVVLTGEGADEAFAGYAYLSVIQNLKKLTWASGLQKPLSSLIGRLPVAFLNMFFNNQASLGSMGRDAAAELIGHLGHTGCLLSRAMATMGDEELAQGTHLQPPPELETTDLSLPALLADMRHSWLPEEILHKMDHLSMAHGLEARVPFVSPILFQQLSICPDAILFGRTGDKPILRALAEREGLAAARRRKLGFQLSVAGRWREPFQRLCRQWLSPDTIRKHGVVKEGFVKERVKYLEKGEFLAEKQLTSMIALHAWMEANQAIL